MTKEKKSFLERLTGSKRIENENERMDTMNVFTEEEETEITMPHNNPFRPAIRQEEEKWATAEEDEGNNDGEGQLTIDVYQTDSDIVIKSTIAGVKPEDLEVSINNDMVTIKGERKTEEEITEENYYYQECYWGSFSRSVVLPVDVLSDKSEASLKNGILTIKLPKAATNQIKKIQVRGF
ncbi:MAG: Hsp20/alpha crystallin family protein [Candidatus Moranbacteria bacterium]|jgi:HSP20 family protein|nr:Hsp20/alpha crystallin family protein [Candidatus Moranbacteria bacterium]